MNESMCNDALAIPRPERGWDPELPTLSAALTPAAAREALLDRLRRSCDITGDTSLHAIRVVAYKPGRRCLIEYQLATPRRGAQPEMTAVLGKIRANRFGNSGYRMLSALWDAGFTSTSRDGISVPEPLATVPTLRMWVQRKMPGRVATSVLPGPDGTILAGLIAHAVHKLHTAEVPAERRHTIDDELQILARCLGDVARAHPELAPSIDRLVETCGRVAVMLPEPAWCGSHRDFYSDQVLVDGNRLFLIDFDLYCEADPGLDVGNFLGHVTEQSLRLFGRADALAHVERSLENRFVALAGEHVRWPVRVYAALTIARHVYLSTRVPGRAHITRALLALAHERLYRVSAEGGHA